MNAVQKLVAVLLIVTCGARETLLAASISWDRLRTLRPGTTITLRDHGKRVFLTADEATVRVIDPKLPGVPRSVRNMVQDLIATQPATFLALTRGGNLVASNVRIDADGAFVNNQKVAELDAVVNTLPRSSLIGDDAISDGKMGRGKKIAIIAAIAGAVIFLPFVLSCWQGELCS
jgi:hypothetical protein